MALGTCKKELSYSLFVFVSTSGAASSGTILGIVQAAPVPTRPRPPAPAALPDVHVLYVYNFLPASGQASGIHNWHEV